MKIESSSIDPKTRSGSLRLLPNNNDDIYYLSTIIAAGDRVSSYTTRKVSLDGGKTQKKITLKLEIKVESLESDLETGVIYVKGKTSCENEHVRIGSYHTVDISVGNAFSLTKIEWKPREMGKIKECTHEHPEICFVIFFEKDSVISTVSSNDVKIVHKEETKSKNFKELISNVIKLKPQTKNFVVTGISDARTEFYKQLIKEDGSMEKISTVLKLTPEYRGLSNSKTISRVLSDKAMIASLQNIQFVDDIKEMQRFFTSMEAGNTDVCIGIKEVGEAMEYGALKILFITDRFRRPKTVSEREFADGFVKKAVELRAKVCTIPVALDPGERLDSLGGVACSLAFSYK